MNPKRIFLAALVAATVGGGLLGVSPAQAGHFDNPGTTKVCHSTSPSTVECVLTLTFSSGYFLGGGETVTVNLAPGTNAQYTSAAQSGGSCAVSGVTTTPTTLTATLTGPCQQGDTIVLTEQLQVTGSGGGQVCQMPDITGNFPIITVCDPNFVIPPPTPQTKEDCKKGQWALYTNPAFKNQGDCVSFVATHGKNPPAG